ncbi:acetyl-CoA acetyltransferase [Ideonella sp.]|uniref:acetyl-CoA acetyltransferase n=1 Tax=Ideonella sp. TaxID=1929293 RepID=UPI0035B1ED68
MKTAIVGWGHTRFGRLDEHDLESLIVAVAREAVEHAGLEFRDIDAIALGHLNGGLIKDSFCSSLALQADPALRFVPATRLENACASGSAALYHGQALIESGRARHVLVIGAEKMTTVSGEAVTAALASASYVKEEAAEGLSFPGIFARIAQDYFARFGDQAATLARIAVKNHANGARNPLAHLQRALDFDTCNTVSASNPIIVAPLRKTDCSLVSDGAAAVVLTDVQRAQSFPRAVGLRATVQVNDFLPLSRRDAVCFEGPARAFAQAYTQAGITVADLDFAEVHDCFTIAELLSYEAMGLAPTGQGVRALDDGTVLPGGRLPVNLSGGLKAKGHPIGATGVSMHVMAAKQLTGSAGALQCAGAELGAVFNMGGSAVASYVSILETLKA